MLKAKHYSNILSKRYNLFRNYTLFLVALGLSLILMFANALRPWTKDLVVLSIFSKINLITETAWYRSTGYIKDLYQSYIDLVEVEKENAKLRQRVSELELENSKLRHYHKELIRVQQLIGFKKRFPYPLKTGEIISKWKQGGFESFRVNIGSIDGIKPKMAVITDYALVGRVFRTSLHYSDIQPITHPDMFIDILLERTRLRGVINGFGTGLLQWSPIKREDIKIGDLAVSSGLIDNFPKGLPVAKVVKIIYGIDYSTQKIMLKPFNNLKNLEQVFIVVPQRNQLISKSNNKSTNK